MSVTSFAFVPHQAVPDSAVVLICEADAGASPSVHVDGCNNICWTKKTKSGWRVYYSTGMTQVIQTDFYSYQQFMETSGEKFFMLQNVMMALFSHPCFFIIYVEPWFFLMQLILISQYDNSKNKSNPELAIEIKRPSFQKKKIFFYCC